MPRYSEVSDKRDAWLAAVAESVERAGKPAGVDEEVLKDWCRQIAKWAELLPRHGDSDNQLVLAAFTDCSGELVRAAADAVSAGKIDVPAKDAFACLGGAVRIFIDHRGGSPKEVKPLLQAIADVVRKRGILGSVTSSMKISQMGTTSRAASVQTSIEKRLDTEIKEAVMRRLADRLKGK